MQDKSQKITKFQRHLKEFLCSHFLSFAFLLYFLILSFWFEVECISILVMNTNLWFLWERFMNSKFVILMLYFIIFVYLFLICLLSGASWGCLSFACVWLWISFKAPNASFLMRMFMRGRVEAFFRAIEKFND